MGSFVEPIDSVLMVVLWLSEFHGCTCSINCTGYTVVYESICYKSMPMSWGTER